MGESFGPWRMGDDTNLAPLVSSANLACGFHASDPSTMRRSIELCLRHGLALGAHPGYPDKEGFGRRRMTGWSQEDLTSMVHYQLGALGGMARAQGGTLRHVKLHGALYNQASEDLELATCLMAAFRAFDAGLNIYVSPHTALETAARDQACRMVREVFTDRTYREDGTLTPRSEPGAVLTDPEVVAERTVALLASGTLVTQGGRAKPVPVESLALHGDNPGGLACARAIHARLREAGYEIRAPSQSQAQAPLSKA